MDRKVLASLVAALSLAAVSTGCNSPYHADRGALFGGLTGAGVGAIVGNAVGNTGAGAAIGAATGVIAGSAIGGEMDEMEARNRAEIEARMGRQISAGAVTIADVVAMSQSGVAEELIVNHIRANGTTAPLQARDLIYLQQQGVSPPVVQAMQEPPQARPVVVREQPAPVIIEEHYYDPWGPPRWHYGYHHGHYRRHRPGMSWGVSVSH